MFLNLKAYNFSVLSSPGQTSEDDNPSECGRKFTEIHTGGATIFVKGLQLFLKELWAEVEIVEEAHG